MAVEPMSEGWSQTQQMPESNSEITVPTCSVSLISWRSGIYTTDLMFPLWGHFQHFP